MASLFWEHIVLSDDKFVMLGTREAYDRDCLQEVICNMWLELEWRKMLQNQLQANYGLKQLSQWVYWQCF